MDHESGSAHKKPRKIAKYRFCSTEGRFNSRFGFTEIGGLWFSLAWPSGALGFLERVRVAQAHAEALNAHAIHVRDRGRDRAIAKLQAKFRELCKAQAVPHKIREVQAAIDKVGRVTRVPIKLPNKLLPEIDMQVANLFGITERMVRRCRTDPKLQRFMPHPV